jgi:hypothetical protein
MVSDESRDEESTKTGTDNSDINKQFLELQAMRLQKDKIEVAYRQIYPKVDPFFVHDLVIRMQEDQNYKQTGPMYTVEVFTKQGIDPEVSRRHILETTGMVPAIYDKGTHYVTQMRVTPEILKKLNDIEYVIEVYGEYCGTDASIGPSHELGDFRKRYRDDGIQKNTTS